MDKCNYNLRPLWDSIIDIYLAFAKVCEKHNLRFYVTGGTALGAMRHGGFIPWDDDFDIVMPRPDYIQFFEIYHKEMPDFYKAIDFRTDLNSELFGKVYESRQNIIDRITNESKLKLDQGIFIDIIPIDGLPKKSIPFMRWIIGRMAWRKYGVINKMSICVKFLWLFIAKLYGVPKDPKRRRLMFEKWLSKWNYDTSSAVDDYNTNPRRLKHRVLTRNTFEPARMVKFDKVMVPVPNDVEMFLCEIFGDWKSLPPVEKRVPSHQIVN